MGSGLYDDTPEGRAMEAKNGSPKKMTPGDAWDSFTYGPRKAWDWFSGASHNDYQASMLQPGQEMAESRQRQGSNLDPLQSWAYTGQGPSQAQALLDQNRDRNIAAAMSMSKSGVGGNYALGQEQAAQGAVQANTAATAEAAQLRAKEQQDAMALYQKALDAYRSGDVDTYKAMAEAYAQKESENRQTAAENAANKKGFVGGLVGGALGGLSL